METICKHLDVKEYTCCGSNERKEMPFCRKRNAVISMQSDGTPCSSCLHREDIRPETSRLKKIAGIAKCYITYTADKIPLPNTVKKAIVRPGVAGMAQKRIAACKACRHVTYLTIPEYNKWIEQNGGYEKFAKDINRLETWPNLPIVKKEQAPAAAMKYCSLCKCLVEPKAYGKNEKCLDNNPQWNHHETE